MAMEGKTATDGGANGMRAAVDYWNERVKVYRDKAGADAVLPADALINHPACEGLASMYRQAFCPASVEDSETWACDLLAKVSHDEDGNILIDGKGRAYANQLIEWSNITADRAADRGRIAECGYAATMAALWSRLKIVIWESDPDEDTITFALRGASV